MGPFIIFSDDKFPLFACFQESQIEGEVCFRARRFELV